MEWLVTLTRLRTFLAVAESGSVRGAAARLVVTESAVSASLTALQRSLGLRLVRPAGRGVDLTEAGRVYADYVRQALGLLESGRVAAAGESDPEGGDLRIAAVAPAGEQLLPRLLHSFRRDHPQVRVTLEIGNRKRVHDLLDHHEADLVVGGRPTGEWEVLAVRRNELLVVVAPDQQRTAPRTWSRCRRWLEDQLWLLREPGSGTQATTEVLLEELEIAPRTMTIGSNAAIREAVITGLGVSLMSRDAVARDLASGSLATIDTPKTPLRRDWHLITRPGRPPATAALFVRHLVTVGEFVTVPHQPSR